jgi:hypothetical protein
MCELDTVTGNCFYKFHIWGPLSMPKFRNLSLFLALAAFAINTAMPIAEGQTLASTATFSGSVSDSSGARLANANVTLSSLEKGITRAFKTDAEGNFSFALLPAATYSLSVSAPGFKTSKVEGIVLEVGQSSSQTVTLTVGTAEQIEVTAMAPLLQTDNANIGAEISTKQVTELPLNLRNVFNFVELNSSVNNLSQRQTISSGGQQGSSDQDASFLNFGGGYFGTNAFLLDGAWDVTSGWGGVIYVPSPDNVQEFKVQQHSFTAQYGWSTGNVLSIVTKSGGSQLHGDVYDYLRNGALDARYYFLDPKAKKPNSHRNQFGVALGGPVYIPGIYKRRDKTFFFFNFEGHRDHNAGDLAKTAPLPAFKNGDFSALLGPSLGTDCAGNTIFTGQIYDPFGTLPCGARQPIPGNNLATYTSPFVPGGAGNLINPIGQNLINFYPTPTSGGVQNNWSGSGLLADYSDEYSGRIDHNFNDNTRLYGRYSYKKEYKDEEAAFYGASNPAGPGQRNPNNRWDIGLGLSKVFTPTFTMSVNLGGMKWVEGNDMQSKGFKSSSLGLPSFLDTYSPQFPIINMPTGFLPEGPVAGAGQGAFPRAASSGSVDFVKVHRAHQLSFGYMAVEMDENGGRDYQAGFTFDGVFSGGPTPLSPSAGTGNPFASMLMGVPANGTAGIAISAVSRTWLHGMYLQDDWKATKKLTLNLGLRYEIQKPVTDRYNRQAWFNYDAINPISSAVGQNYTGELQFASSSHRSLFDTDYKNFAPRIGFAYQLMPKLVMRGGYGVFYPPTYHGGGPAPGFTSVTPYVASNNGGVTANTLSSAFSGGLIPVSGSSLGGLTDVGFSAPAVSLVRKTYYVQQWSYGFEFAPTNSDVIDLTYVGNHGVHVHASGLNLNQLDPTYFSMGAALLSPVPNPFSGAITSSSCGGAVPYDLSAPSVPQGALLRPHPQFCDINENQDPAGDSHYNALDVNYTHRVSQGLTLLASYTFSKFIDNVGGPENWANASANFSENIRNVYNLAAEKSVDATDTPHSFVLSYVYELPVGRGRKFASGVNGVVNAIVGGWQTSGTLTLKEGFPLTITQSDSNPFGVGQHVNVVGDYHVPHPSIAQWFNPAAFAQAPQFDLGNAPRYFSDLRAPNYKNWDMSIQKYFPIQERYRVQFRLDMFNTFNHPNFYSPNTFFGGAGSGFGTINQAWTPRLMQAALKFYW